MSISHEIPSFPESKKILIIDDSELIRRLLRNVLEESYVVYEAANGALGYQSALDLAPDLIMTDLLMPEMDGYELVKAVRDHHSTSHIPVIMLTSVHGDDNQMQGYRLGVDAYLIKPFRREELLVRVASLLQNRSYVVDFARRVPQTV
jgi:DNA-binding response OmpR family regulator